MVKTRWAGRPNGQRDLLPGANNGLHLSYLWTNVTRGETYVFTVSTALPAARDSKELTVQIRKSTHNTWPTGAVWAGQTML